MPTIYCNNIDNIVWEESSPGSYKLANAAHIWRIQISVNLHLLQLCMSVLDTEENIRAQSYHNIKDRNRFILCRGVLRFLLGSYCSLKPRDVLLVVGKNKKPLIQGAGTINLHYNLAHSKDEILIAIGDSTVGIDVEYIDTDFEFAEILRTCFSKEEIDFIQKAQYSRSLFYLLWTRKEALVKATSKGIDDDLTMVPCLDGKHSIESAIIGSKEDWIVCSFETEKQYISSISYKASITGISFRDTKKFLDRLTQMAE